MRNTFKLCKSLAYINRMVSSAAGTRHCTKSFFSTSHAFRQVQNTRLSRPDSNLLYKKKRKGAGDYALLIVPVVTFCLGTWQIRRREWKLNLIKILQERPKSDPVPFPKDRNELTTPDMEYRPVRVTGSFDHSRELNIHPRTAVQNDDIPYLQYSDPVYGVQIITAFNVKDRNLRILVNRGWVPPEFRNPKSRLEGQVEGDIEIIGIVRRPETKPGFASNNPATNDWLYRDTKHMAQELNTEPIFLDLVESCTPKAKNSPLGGQTRITLRNEHLSYIITWYSLSILTFAMWLVRRRGKR